MQNQSKDSMEIGQHFVFSLTFLVGFILIFIKGRE
jgi:hypothetical protein